MRIGRYRVNFFVPIRVRKIRDEEYLRVLAWQSYIDMMPGEYSKNVFWLDGGDETVLIENGRVISVY